MPHLNEAKEGKPTLLNLRDLTGEGIAAQFVLFEYLNCGGALTSVFGYSRALDRAVQYPIELVEGTEKGERVLWIGHTFEEKPRRPGYWDFNYEPGHGADGILHFRVQFDRARQVFVQRQISFTPYPDMPLLKRR